MVACGARQPMLRLLKSKRKVLRVSPLPPPGKVWRRGFCGRAMAQACGWVARIGRSQRIFVDCRSLLGGSEAFGRTSSFLLGGPMRQIRRRSCTMRGLYDWCTMLGRMSSVRGPSLSSKSDVQLSSSVGKFQMSPYEATTWQRLPYVTRPQK